MAIFSIVARVCGRDMSIKERTHRNINTDPNPNIFKPPHYERVVDLDPNPNP